VLSSNFEGQGLDHSALFFGSLWVKLLKNNDNCKANLESIPTLSPDANLRSGKDVVQSGQSGSGRQTGLLGIHTSFFALFFVALLVFAALQPFLMEC